MTFLLTLLVLFGVGIPLMRVAARRFERQHLEEGDWDAAGPKHPTRTPRNFWPSWRSNQLAFDMQQGSDKDSDWPGNRKPPRSGVFDVVRMDVRIVDFPETRVAVAEHRGPPALEHESSRRLIAWRIANRLSPDRHATYGVHYTDPRTTPPADHRVDFCVAFDGDVEPNAQGIVSKTIPGGRCAVARHLGSRDHVGEAEELCSVWLPGSGEVRRDFPIFFHYVNVGPQLRETDMNTDVYLPLR